MRAANGRRYQRVVPTVLFCLVLQMAALAQSTTTGAICGSVSDASRAMISKARVTVLNLETQRTATGTTDASGAFRVVALSPGSYELSVEAASFAPYQARGIVVEVGRMTQVEVALAAGGKVENVEVTGEAPTVNTVQQDFSSNLDQPVINNLPINGRRWTSFALLSPGTTPDGDFGLISFRGISGLLNSQTVDGGDNNQAFFSEERGRTRAAYTVSQAAVREFQVNTSNYSAEYGRAAGGVVNSVTKSGSNNLHGEAFYYVRDNTLGATNPFSDTYISDGPGNGYSAAPYKPQDNRQQFGGNFGGALIQDKLFYFFNYDAQRRNFPGDAVPQSSSLLAPIDATTELPKLAEYHLTQAQFNQGLAFLAAETGPVPRTADENTFFPKLDWLINGRNTLTVSYNRMRWNSPDGMQTQPTDNYGVASFGNDYVQTDMLNARLASTLTYSLGNELRYQWGRDFEYGSSQPPSAAELDPCAAMGIATANCPTLVTSLITPGAPRAPEISISGGIVLGRPNTLERSAYPDEVRNQISDSMTWMHGRHLVKFGFDLDRNNDLLDNLYYGGGQYSYSSRLAFISDLINNGQYQEYSSFYQGFGSPAIGFHTWDYAGFLQDSWRLRPGLTLNVGVRYEYEALPAPQYPNPAIPQTTKMPSDKNNFGPRVGFAWDVFGDGKTALRGGYGIYYGRINNSAIGSALLQTGASGSQELVNLSYSSAGAPIFPQVFTSAPAFAPSVAYLDPHLRNPRIYEADLIVEREVSPSMVLSASYLMSLGRELPQFIDTNIAPSTSTASYVVQGGPFNGQTFTVPFYSARLNPNFGAMIDVQSSVNSSYNAMVLQLNRRMREGVQFMASYTWSHAIDNGQNSTTQTPAFSNVFDPYNPGLEKSSSNYDVRQRLVTSVVWHPRRFRDEDRLTKAALDGWDLAPIIQIATGEPYTESVSGSDYTCCDIRGNSTSNYGVGGGINGSGGVYRLAPLLGRNSFRYPNLENVDLRLSRRFKITEGQTTEFLVEAFNLFNHEQINGINQTMYVTQRPSVANAPTVLAYANTVAGYSDFGSYNQAGSSLYREREIQFAFRYHF